MLTVARGRIYLDNFTCCQTEIDVADRDKPDTSLRHSILTPGQPVQKLTPKPKAAGRVATGVSIVKSLVGFSRDLNRVYRGGRLNQTQSGCYGISEFLVHG